MQTFVNNMVTRDFNEYEICKVVPSFLRGKAQNWFSNTQPESLWSYRCFARFLLHSFFQKKKFTMMMIDVSEEGRQKTGEETQTHYHRFVDLCMNCVDRTDAIIIHAYTQSINDQTLYRKLLAKAPKTLQQLQAIVEKYSRCEGGMKRKFEGDHSAAAKAEKGKSFEAKPKKPEAIKPAFETYTPLSKSRSEILSIHRQVLLGID